MPQRSPRLHRLFTRYARSFNHPAKIRILNWMRRLFGLNFVTVDVLGGLMRLDTSDYVQSKIFMEGAYEPKTLGLMRRLLQEGDCFIDVGANVGQFSLAATTRVGPSGRVIAIEPNPEICAELFINCRLSGAQNAIRIVCAALDRESRLLNFAVPPPSNRGMSREASLPALVHQDWYVVSSVRLDDVLRHLSIDRVNVVKIDVEGNELRVLEGLLDGSKGCEPDNILFEFLPDHFSYGQSPQDLLLLLRKHQYDILTVEEAKYRFGDKIPEENLWARRRAG